MDVGDKVAILNSGGRRICVPVTSPNLGDIVVVAPALGGKTMAIKGGEPTTRVWEFMQALPSAQPSYVRAIEYLGNGIVVAGTYHKGLIYRSTDYGVTWALAANIGDYGISSLTDLGGGICIGTHAGGYWNNGRIIRSVDYGASFGVVQTMAYTSLYNGSVNCGSGVCVAIIDGTVWRSANYGLTWSAVGSIPSIYGGAITNRVIHHSAGILILGTTSETGSTGGTLICKSTDYGSTWTVKKTFSGSIFVSSLESLGAQILCGVSGQIWGSWDVGESWSLVSATGVEGLEYTGGSTCYGGGGQIIKTEDYGVTWATDQILPSTFPYSFVSTSGYIWCGVGNTAGIWRKRI